MKKFIFKVLLFSAITIFSTTQLFAESWPNFHRGNTLIKDGKLYITDGLILNGGSKITKIFSREVSNLITASINANEVGTLGTLLITGVVSGDSIIVTPVAVSSGIETTNLLWSAYVGGPGSIIIRAVNTTGSGVDILDTQEWQVTVIQDE